MDHAQQPDSGDRLPPVTLLSFEGTLLEECSWHACKDRRPQCRLSEDVRWLFPHLARVWLAIGLRSSLRSHFEWRTHPQDRGRKPVPTAVCPCEHRSIAHSRAPDCRSVERFLPLRAPRGVADRSRAGYARLRSCIASRSC